MARVSNQTRQQLRRARVCSGGEAAAITWRCDCLAFRQITVRNSMRFCGSWSSRRAPALCIFSRTPLTRSIQSATGLLDVQLGAGCVNADIIQDIVAAISARRAPTHFFWVHGHSGHAHNDAADALAKEGAKSEHTISLFNGFRNM